MKSTFAGTLALCVALALLALAACSSNNTMSSEEPSSREVSSSQSVSTTPPVSSGISSSVPSSAAASSKTPSSNDDSLETTSSEVASPTPLQSSGNQDKQDIIPISQVFERDGFTLDRITNMQLSINPDGSSVIVTTPEDIQAVWDTLSKLRITSEGADQVRINEEKTIAVDIQFANPNHATHVVWSGPIVIHGRELYTFAEGSSEQVLYDLIYGFIEPKPLASIEVMHTALFADDGCLLFDNEHYELLRDVRDFKEEYTPETDVVLAQFSEETEIEGIIWFVYSAAQYPNREYLCLISGTNANWLCRRGCPYGNG